MVDAESNIINFSGVKERQRQTEVEVQKVLRQLKILQQVGASFALKRLFERILSLPDTTEEDVDLSLMIKTPQVQSIQNKVYKEASLILEDTRFISSIGEPTCSTSLGYNPTINEEDSTGELYWSSYDAVRITATSSLVLVSKGVVDISYPGKMGKYKKHMQQAIGKGPHAQLLVARTAEIFYESRPVKIPDIQ